MNGNEFYKVKEFSLQNITASGGYYASGDTFEQWQKENPRIRVVGVIPFQKTWYSVNPQSQVSTQSDVATFPIPKPTVENWFLVQYFERDLEKQATQLETFLKKDEQD